MFQKDAVCKGFKDLTQNFVDHLYETLRIVGSRRSFVVDWSSLTLKDKVPRNKKSCCRVGAEFLMNFRILCKHFGTATQRSVDPRVPVLLTTKSLETS